ncbi:MAG: TonB-dependent receptor [Spongiibacteraceae bacterium]
MQSKSINHRVSTLVLAIAASSGALADVQTNDTRKYSIIEEVVVTARRKEESLDSVPVTISAFDQNSLQEKSIKTTQDLQTSVPGVFLTGSGSRTNTLYSIRGQARPVTGAGSPGVVTYFQDVPMPVSASSVPQYDVKSIQVLKGPQGTLFGRNTTGGAILTYATSPTYEMGGYISAEVGDYSTRNTEGAINIPIIDDKLAVRLAGQIQRRDGYTKDVGIGNDQDQVDSQSLRASILFEPTDSITNLTTLDYYQSDASTSGAILIDGVPFNLGAGWLRFDLAAQEQAARGPRKTNLNAPSNETTTLFGFTNRTDVDFDNFSITNIVGYRTVDYTIDSQIDGMGGVPLTATATDNNILGTVPLRVLEGPRQEESRQITEEFQIKGTILEDKLNWLVGAFYLKNEPDGPEASATGFFAPVEQTYAFIEEESKALFFNLGYDLSTITDGLVFNVGARKTWDESSLCTGAGEQPTVDGPVKARIDSCGGLASSDKLSYKSDAVTWTIGFDWQIDDDQFAYITTRKGYRAGGINGPKLAGDLMPYQNFEPEITKDVELGYRADWQAGDISGKFNVAIFRSTAEDAQLGYTGLTTAATGSCVTPGSTFIDGDCDPSNDPLQSVINVNVGETQIQGVEFGATVMPARDLTLTLSGTYQDTKTNEYTVPTVFQPFSNSGADIPVLYTPQTSWTVGARYLLPLDYSIGEVVLNADYYYSDKVEMVGYVFNSYDLTTIRANWYSIMGSALDMSIYVRNVFDEEAITAPAALSNSSPFQSAIYNAPRLWGASVTYRFGAN